MSDTFAIRSRQIITPTGVVSGAVVVNDGRIEGVYTNEQVPSGIPVEDIGELALLPGLVDIHVHMNEPGNTDWEGAETATPAAALGGITTLVDMPLNSIPVTTTVSALREKRSAIAPKCRIDVGMHGGLVAGNSEEIPGLINEGVLGIKAFLCDSGLPEFPAVGMDDLVEGMRHLHGTDVPLLAHAEVVSGPPHQWRNPRDGREWCRSRPVGFEIDAIRLLANAREKSGSDCRIHIVHVSSIHVARAIEEYFRGDLRVTYETCPHYLFFSEEDIPEGDTRFKCAPPLRPREDSEALWRMVTARDSRWIIASDHSPCPPEMKHPETGDFSKAWGGISSLQLGLSLVYTLARKRGGADLSSIAQLMAERPAEFVGLQDRKGRIAAGCDADLIAFDPYAEWIVDAKALAHRHKVTPYDGYSIRGRVTRTWLRGEEVQRDGKLTGRVKGRLLQGGK